MDVEQIKKNVSKLPARFIKALKAEMIVGNYIIYDRKKNRAICTRCGKEFPADKTPGRHNKPAICPKCGAKAYLKSKGIGRENLTEYFRTLVFMRNGRTVYGRLDEVTVSFAPWGTPDISFDTVAMYALNSKKQIYVKGSYDYGLGQYWHRCQYVNVPEPPQPMGYYYSKFQETYVYVANLKEVFEKSDLKYLYDDELIQSLGPKGIIRWMTLSLKYQSTELLWKAGFHNIVSDRLRGIGSRYINWRATTLAKILKVPTKAEMKRIRDKDLRINEFEVYKVLRNYVGVEPSINLAKEFIKRYGVTSKTLKEQLAILEKYISPNVAIAYLQKQKQCFDMGDYIDYIQMAEKLGMDVSRKNVLFPRDLKKAHDDCVDAIQVETNKKREKKIAEHALNITYENAGLMVIEAKSIKDLIEESRQLGHCVRTYGDRVASGKSHIFMIRHKEDPEKSFYTMEINAHGDMVQCRGDHNCIMTPEVEEFAGKFQKYVKKEMKGVTA